MHGEDTMSARVELALPESKIAHVFNRMDPGGAELRTVEIVRSIDLSFDFVSVSGAAGSLDDNLRSDGHEVHVLRLAVRNFRSYTTLMRRREYKVIHSHLGLASGPVLLLARLAGVPIRIAHFRSDAVGGRKSVLKSTYLWLSRQMIKLCATNIVGVSPGSLKYGWSNDWRQDPRCQVIPNGFDVAGLRRNAELGRGLRNSNAEQDELVLVNVGRPDPVKNRGRALAIWLALSETQKSKLYMVGGLNQADMDAATRGRLQSANGSEAVIVGESDSVAEYIGAADVLLTTSTREGLPGVVLEALAVGTPVVASGLPGSEWIASILPGVQICSLSNDNSEWIAALKRAPDFNRAEIMAAFDEGPFTMDRAIASFRKLWGLSQ